MTAPGSTQFSFVTRERHSKKKWLRPSSYAFAALDALAPLVGIELATAARALPLAFSEQGGHYTLVAVLSLAAGRNMFVGPDGGWLGAYIPAWYRSYPFRVVSREEMGAAELCVDESAGLVAEGSDTGEDFFDEDGNASSALKPVIDLLARVESSRKATNLAVSTLAEAGVITPWRITLKTEEGERAIGGLHRIDETVLGTLPDDVFLKLRAASALPVAYAQMLSVGQLEIFERLARLQAQLAPPTVAALPDNLDSFFGLSTEDMIIKFD